MYVIHGATMSTPPTEQDIPISNILEEVKTTKLKGFLYYVVESEFAYNYNNVVNYYYEVYLPDADQFSYMRYRKTCEDGDMVSEKLISRIMKSKDVLNEFRDITKEEVKVYDNGETYIASIYAFQTLEECLAWFYSKVQSK